MRPIHPLFFLFLFFNSTVFLPILTTGIRVDWLWYSPLADTGRVTFLYPFLVIVAVYVIASVIIGAYLYTRKRNRFILVEGPMGVRTVLRTLLKDRKASTTGLVYGISFALSFLIVSGLLLVPNLNVASPFYDLTVMAWQGEGIPYITVGPVSLALNLPLTLIGVVVTLILTISMLLGYYITSLVYVSSEISRFPIPSTLRLAVGQSFGGFLSATVPSLGTSAGICCLTPVGVNSLLYLASAGIPVIGKKIVWSSGMFAGVGWMVGVLGGAELLSTVLVGTFILSVSIYGIRRIAERVNQMVVNSL